VAQKFHFAILRIEVTRASRGLSAIAELLFFYQLRAAQLRLLTAVKINFALIYVQKMQSVYFFPKFTIFVPPGTDDMHL